MTSDNTKVCLTIAGLDPSGGAGIIADIKTFEAFGCFATAAISSLTFQNTTGVFGAVHSSAETIRGQVEPIVNDFTISAIKTGMLPTREVIEETARLLRDHGLANLVVDPVVRSTSGFDLIDNQALRSLIEYLFPLADLITPNVPEAERISGVAIENEEDIVAAAGLMREMGARNVLIKGGHLKSGWLTGDRRQSKTSSPNAVDYLFTGSDLSKIVGEYHETTATHGTGCTLSAAIVANLALGRSLRDAVTISKQFVNEAIRTAPNIGRGHSPINIKPI
ncbi:MAG TPA: bifunctional hydroxymethylpyrimidine kinase/phosphomethylpyrimidine kinase [Pyrinomonadaceae bacterium]|nr:bifunctional hydroxymethylpyrimidine kinase/phosphomethylpyrimidine kinase [Pyrinomonadaceae bacterium]